MSDRDKKILAETKETDEPIFIFRAKDILSMFPLKEYERRVEDYAGDDHEHLMAISVRITEFRDWQRNNADKIKLPD